MSTLDMVRVPITICVFDVSNATFCIVMPTSLQSDRLCLHTIYWLLPVCYCWRSFLLHIWKIYRRKLVYRYLLLIVFFFFSQKIYSSRRTTLLFSIWCDVSYFRIFRSGKGGFRYITTYYRFLLATSAISNL